MMQSEKHKKNIHVCLLVESIPGKVEHKIVTTNLKLGEWQWFIELEEVCKVF